MDLLCVCERCAVTATCTERCVGEISESATDIVALAPHGGSIEPYTEDQAELCAQETPGCGAWIRTGTATSDSAFSAWHIPSTQLSRQNTAYLASVAEAAPQRAISFHGFAPGIDVDIYVGGGADRAVRATVADQIRTALPASQTVTIARRTDPLYRKYGGISRQNIVNWVGERGGIQIEQQLSVRKRYSGVVARATVESIADTIVQTKS